MKILGYSYKIEQLGKDVMRGNSGFCNFDNKLLQVSVDLDKDMKESTLLHEIIEALNYHMELELKHNQIMSLEAGLHQVLNDNGVELSPLLENKEV